MNEAFMYACHLQHETAAALLLDRSIALDMDMGRRIDAGPGRPAFIQYFIANKPDVHNLDPDGPWHAFVKQQVVGAIHDDDLTSFVDALRRDAWLLSDARVKFQVRLIEGTAAALDDRAAFLTALLDLDPAVLHCPVPPASRAAVGGAWRRCQGSPLRISHLLDEQRRNAGLRQANHFRSR